MKIIIVDDEMVAHHTFLSDVIGKTDADYRFFKDDVPAIEDYIRKNKVAAAFLDVSMPSVNGFELAEKLVALDGDLRIVFVTGLDVTPEELSPAVRERTAGFLYKPYDPDELRNLLAVIEGGARKLTARMFGSFECFVGEVPVRFSSNKSKELFALLLAYDGDTLSMTDAISQLWPDLDTDKSKSLYRDAVWRLRKTLQQIGFNCVEFRRACLVLDKENIECDYWDLKRGLSSEYRGEFCKSYDWSVDYLAALDVKEEAKNRRT